MATTIKNANIFGRIGSGVGQGLAEQIPKEIERGRLSAGLKQFEQDAEDLTPLQQYSRIRSIPGIGPADIQALPELLKNQSARNYYAGKGKGQKQESSMGGIGREGQMQPPLSNEPNQQPSQFQQQTEYQPQGQTTPGQEPGQPQIVEKNPLRPEAQPGRPWTQEERDQDISRVFENNPQLTLPEAVNISADNERRALAQPEAIQAQDKRLKEIQGDLNTELDSQLKTKLQAIGKGEEGLYKDLTGEMLNNLRRGAERDLRLNPNANIKDVANKWSNLALDLSKTNSLVDSLAKQDIVDQITKGGDTLESLQNYQKIYGKAGNNEEYYNKLKSDFNLSPDNASWIAYPRSKKVQEYINSAKPSKERIPQDWEKNTRKYASNIESLITSGDSLLSIARELKFKDPFFDQNLFFKLLKEDQDNLALTPRQQRELGEASSAQTQRITPTWGDFSIFPMNKGNLK